MPSLARAQEPSGSWGSNHVGRPLPDYMTGEECLFCHRDDVAFSWSENPHQHQMRLVDKTSGAFVAVKTAGGAQAGEATVELGAQAMTRYLKPSGRYGHYSLLNLGYAPKSEQVIGEPPARWDDAHFAARCAGCHTTAVAEPSGAFSSPGLDCYTCHGAIEPQHANQPELMRFSKQRDDPPLEVLSVCGSCHLRGGRSRSTGKPYANQFVPGDDLLLDFAIDGSEGALATMTPGDRHIFESAAAVTQRNAKTTCLTCHSVHDRSSERHEQLRPDASCATCHPNSAELSLVIAWQPHNATCEY